MKALFVSLGAATALFAVAPGTSSVMSIGNSLARGCFLAAEARLKGADAIDDCTRALSEEALDKNDRVATLVNRGILRLIGNDYRNASRDFDEAIAIDPSEPEAWLNKAILSIKRADGANIFPMVDRALLLKTRKPALAYYVRGIANEEAGNLKQAYADLVRARDLAPNWADPSTELRRYKLR